MASWAVMSELLRVGVPLGLALIAAALAVPLPPSMPSSATGATSSAGSSTASGSSASEPQCPRDVRALVDGPPRFGDWSLVRLDCTRARQLDLEVVRGETHAVLTVAAEGAVAHSPPAHAGGFALFYGGGAVALDPAEVTALLDALSVRIRDNAAPVPSGW
jgi:hypothetical protein